MHRAAPAKDQGQARITYEAAVAKLFATEAAQRIIDRALQLHGGNGLLKGAAVERLYRTTCARWIYEGARKFSGDCASSARFGALKRAISIQERLYRRRRERRILDTRVPLRASHGRHLRHRRSRPPGLPARRPRVVQPRPGPAGDGRAARRPAARGRGVRGRGGPGVRARGRPVGGARGHRHPLQPPLPQGAAQPVHGGERVPVRRRRAPAHPRRGEPGHGEPGPLPARLHRLRGAAGRLQGVHRHPHPAGGRARLRLHARGPAARGAGPRPVRAALLQPVQPHRQAGAGRRAGALGGRGARAGVRAAHRRVLLALRLDGPPGAAPGGERRALRGGREQRPGGPLRRPDEELALPGLAHDVDGGPTQVIEAVSSAGSFLDGGGSRPLQRAAIPLLEEQTWWRDARHPRRVPREAGPVPLAAGADGHPHGPRAGRDVLRLGQRGRAARAAQ